MLKAQLFGAGQIRREVQFLTGFPSQQCCLLLCHLLRNRHRPHHRERLAVLFWGDYSTATARKHLRNTVWRLCCALQPTGARQWPAKNNRRYLYDSSPGSQSTANVRAQSAAECGSQQRIVLEGVAVWH